MSSSTDQICGFETSHASTLDFSLLFYEMKNLGLIVDYQFRIPLRIQEVV